MDSAENIKGCLTGQVWLEDNNSVKSAPVGLNLVVRTSWQELLLEDPFLFLRLK